MRNKHSEEKGTYKQQISPKIYTYFVKDYTREPVVQWEWALCYHLKKWDRQQNFFHQKKRQYKFKLLKERHDGSEDSKR